MGSDRVHIDPLWMICHPVSDARLREFVEATEHMTIAEIVPDPRDYRGSLPDMLHPSSLVFVKSNRHCTRSTGSVRAAQLQCPDRR
jgi:formylglycine-generating enzyme